ncbi:MAG: hypothetical protein U0031_20450 [Thermomicrobiales bacterium]
MSDSTSAAQEITIDVPEGTLGGTLTLSRSPRGIVLFAHGSGSSRHSPRNRHVGSILNRAGLGTLLMDLLTQEEEAIDQYTRQYRFDIDRLSGRLVNAIDWLGNKPETGALPIGLFGASTGAAAALRAAAARPGERQFRCQSQAAPIWPETRCPRSKRRPCSSSRPR